MVHYGITFEIPNKPGHFLGDILSMFDVGDYIWDIEHDEIHLQGDNGYTGEFLFTEKRLNGDALLDKSMTNLYYMVFVTLRAFRKGDFIDRYGSYDEFLKSKSEVFLTVYDCSYVMLCFKDIRTLQEVHNSAKTMVYENIRLLTTEKLWAYNWV